MGSSAVVVVVVVVALVVVVVVVVVGFSVVVVISSVVVVVSAVVVVVAVMISNFRETTDHPSIKEEFIFILKTLIVVLIPSVLTFLEPDTGSVMIYFIIYFCMMFTSGIRLRWFVILGIIIAVMLSLVLGCYFLNEDLFVNIFGTDLYYRFDRILDWQNGSGLQLENALAAIGSAGVFGHGFNRTPIYFPESGTDFIFASIASHFSSYLLCIDKF